MNTTFNDSLTTRRTVYIMMSSTELPLEEGTERPHDIHYQQINHFVPLVDEIYKEEYIEEADSDNSILSTEPYGYFEMNDNKSSGQEEELTEEEVEVQDEPTKENTTPADPLNDEGIPVEHPGFHCEEFLDFNTPFKKVPKQLYMRVISKIDHSNLLEELPAGPKLRKILIFES